MNCANFGKNVTTIFDKNRQKRFDDLTVFFAILTY